MMFPLHKVTKALPEKSSFCVTTIVFIHGNSTSGGVWKHQFNSEILHDFPMVAIDLPGHGRSSRLPNYSVSQLIASLVESLNTYEDVIIVGHSLGGHLAIEALPQLRNCRGFFVFGTPPIKKPVNFQEAFLADERISLLFKGQMDKGERELLAQAVCSKNYPEHQSLLKSIAITDPKFREDMGVSVAKGEFADEAEILRNARMPIAIIHGVGDALVNAEYIDGLEIPCLWEQKVHRIDNSTHSPHIENPIGFNRLLWQFSKVLG